MGLTNFPNGVTSFGLPVMPGVPSTQGKLFHLVPAKTGNYYANLSRNNISDDLIFTTLATAYAAMTDGQGDTLLVYPGIHAVTAGVEWAKSDCRIIGMGSPNQLAGTTTPVTGSVALRCTTTGVSYVLKVSAHHLYVDGVQFINNAANTGNHCDVMFGAGSRNGLFVNCGFRGGNNTTQTQNATAGIPLWVAAETAAGNGTKFVNCWIGSSGNAARTKGPGCIHVVSGAAKGLHFEFDNCRFASRIQTANANGTCLINIPATAIGRYWYFKQCLFYNFWNNHTDKLDYCIRDANQETKDIIFDNCSLVGIEYWSDAHAATSSIWTTVANAGTDGGKAAVVKVSG